MRAVLTSALDSPKEEKGGRFVTQLIGQVRGFGGFLEGNDGHFIGEEAIKGMIAVLRDEGFALMSDGQLLPQMLGFPRTSET